MGTQQLIGVETLADDKRQVIVVQDHESAEHLAHTTGRLVVSHTADPALVDWQPVAGRGAVLWPRVGGSGWADTVAAILTDLGGAVKVMAITDKPAGWTPAVAVEDDKWTRADLDGFMKQTAAPWSPPPDLVPDEPDRRDTVPASFLGFEDGPGPDDQMIYGPEYDEPYLIDGDGSELDVTTRREVGPQGREHGRADLKIFGGDVSAMREWAFLKKDAVFVNVHTGETVGKMAFDLSMEIACPTIEMLNSKGESEPKVYPASKTLVSYLDAVVVSDRMYRPDVPDLAFGMDGVQYLNSYLPSYVPRVDPDWKYSEAWELVDNHIHNIVPDGADVIIQWMAHNVQFPGRKILWSPVVVGVQGDGKTTMASALQAAMGMSNVKPVSAESLNSDFTAWAYGAAVRVLEEIHVTGRDRGAVMDKLKPFLTNSSVEAVGKGQDGRTIVNVTNYFGLSNYDDALAIDEGDRRWGVWKTRFRDRQHARAEMSKEYWTALHGAVNSNQEVLRGWLMSIDLSNFDRFNAPENLQAKKMMIEAARAPLVAEVMEAVELGGVGIGADVIAADCVTEAVRTGGGRSASTTGVGKILDGMGWLKFEKAVKWNGKARRVFYRPEFLAGVDEDARAGALRRALEDTDDAPDMGYRF